MSIFTDISMSTGQLYNSTRHALDRTAEWITRMPAEARGIGQMIEAVGGQRNAPPGGWTADQREARAAVTAARDALQVLDGYTRAGLAEAKRRGLIRERDGGAQGPAWEVVGLQGLGALPLVVVVAIVIGVAYIITRFIDHGSWADALATYTNRRELARAAILRLTQTGQLPKVPDAVFGGDAAANPRTTAGQDLTRVAWVGGSLIALAVIGPALIKAFKGQ